MKTWEEKKNTNTQRHARAHTAHTLKPTNKNNLWFSWLKKKKSTPTINRNVVCPMQFLCIPTNYGWFYRKCIGDAPRKWKGRTVATPCSKDHVYSICICWQITMFRWARIYHYVCNDLVPWEINLVNEQAFAGSSLFTEFFFFFWTTPSRATRPV